MAPPAFGRAAPRTRAGRPPIPPKRLAGAPEPSPVFADPVDQELAAWNRGRRRPPFPWRSFAWMMSLCFGAAAAVLPDSVNEAVRYVLYAITAITFLGGIARRRKKPS